MAQQRWEAREEIVEVSQSNRPSFRVLIPTLDNDVPDLMVHNRIHVVTCDHGTQVPDKVRINLGGDPVMSSLG